MTPGSQSKAKLWNSSAKSPRSSVTVPWSTYGLFEARLRVPKGKGFLPAFWLMTTDEDRYGQWPECGEIDIMEIMGDRTGTNHGTIHYGLPHEQDQGTVTLDRGDSKNYGFL